MRTIKFLDGTTRVFSSLSGAYLRGADLRDADLRGADLQDADLHGAVLRGADLHGAVLRGANLQDVDLHGAKGLSRFVVAGEGDIVGYKKLARGAIATLVIPSAARRVNKVGSRKCRAEWAVVTHIEGARGDVACSAYDPTFIYSVGDTVRPREPFNDDIREECASGIHFFITRQEAEDY
jgi:Family of unknown function (DUF5758)/Pentapeptide repeats (8 copies)